MEPIRARQATIDDLLERLLETGIILNLDLVIGVAGIPLIGINLKAAIAAVETMIEYGLMQDWDRDLRRYAARELQCKKLALAPGETVILDLYGSHWYSDGIYRAWRPGRLYLTDRRLVVYRQEPAEVLFQAALGDIQDLMVNEETYFTGARRDLLYLALASGDVVSLYAEDIQGLQEAIQANMVAGGRRPTGALLPFTREIEIVCIVKERILADGKMWYLFPGFGVQGDTWRPGWLYLTARRLVWWSDFDGRVGLELGVGQIRNINLDTRDLGGVLNEREVLSLAADDPRQGGESLFVGEALPQWRRQIRQQALDYEGGSSDAGH